MSNEKKEFNLKVYAVIVFILIAVILFTISSLTFKAKYTAYDPQKVAAGFVDTIAQNGDGYDAYKVTIMSKNYKYGDYIRENYIYPLIYAEAGYKAGDSRDGLEGYNNDKYKGEKTKEDDGTLEGQLINEMFKEYINDVRTIGWDNYDEFFKTYFKALVKTRKAIYNDDYLTDDIMFTVLEANVKSAGEMLTGTEEKIDENTGVKLSEETTGIYQTLFGLEYKIVTEAIAETDYSLDEYKTKADKDALESYKISIDEIKEAKTVTVKVSYDADTAINVDIVVVKIGNSWYVDNNLTSTADIYNTFGA